MDSSNSYKDYLSYPATLDSLEKIDNEISNIAIKANLNKIKKYGLLLAVDEIATNIINYGFKKKAGAVLLRVVFSDDVLKVILKYKGKYFNPLKHQFDTKQFKEKLEKRKVGGLGIYLARNSVDKLNYRYIKPWNIYSFSIYHDNNASITPILSNNIIYFGNKIEKHKLLIKNLEKINYKLNYAQDLKSVISKIHLLNAQIILVDYTRSLNTIDKLMQMLKENNLIEQIPVMMLATKEMIKKSRECKINPLNNFICFNDGSEELQFKIGNILARYSISQQSSEISDLWKLIEANTLYADKKDDESMLFSILTEAKSISHAEGGTLYIKEKEHLLFKIFLNDVLKLENKLGPIPLHNEQGVPNFESISSYVALSGNTINIEDIYKSSQFEISTFKDFDRKNNYRTHSVLTIPIKNDQTNVIGVIQLINAHDPITHTPSHFSKHTQKVIEALGLLAGITLNKMLLSEKNLTKLINIGVALSAEKNLDHLLFTILKEAKSISNADGGTLYIRDGNNLKFAIVMNETIKIDLNKQKFPPLKLIDPKTNQQNMANITTFVANTRQSINIENIYTNKEFDFTGFKEFDRKYKYKMKSTLTVPLMDHENHVIGVLQLINAKDSSTSNIISFDFSTQRLVEALASEAAIALSYSFLIEKQKEFIRYENEMQIAKNIQRDFLPDTLPILDGWKISTYFSPALSVGGDFYDAFVVENFLVVVVADIADKGIGATIFMSLFRTLIRAYSEKNLLMSLGLKRVIDLTNNYIITTHFRSNMFATLFIGKINLTNSKLEYINAGHPPAFIVGKNKCMALRTTGPAVGVFEKADYVIKEVLIKENESLFIYSDGVIEAKNVKDEFFGEVNLINYLKNENSSQALAKKIEVALLKFVGKANQYDDITIFSLTKT